MTVDPVVRYMILCEDWDTDPQNRRRVNILGLLSNIHSVERPGYPLLCERLCVLLILTEGRGAGTAEIVCVFEESGRRVFKTPPRQVVFRGDPLDIVGVSFRIQNCRFPTSGMYSVQFWYNNKKLDERPLRLR